MNNSIFQKRFSLLTDTDDLVAISTPERVRKYVNRAYCNFYEKTEEELIGTSYVDDFSEEKMIFYKNFIAQMSPDNPSLTTVQMSGSPENPRWTQWRENGIYDDYGNLVEILTIGRDVHEVISIKREKEELNNLLKAYRDAIDTNIITSITDIRGVITYVNRNFCKISQFSVGELIGHNHNVVNSGHHPRAFFVEMWQTLLAGKMWHGEIKNKAKDGSFYWVKTVIIPIRDSHGQVDRFLSLRVLITDQKELEEGRTRYLQSLEEMLFMVSHELRKPITNCLGLLGLMKNDVPTAADYHSMVDHMIEAATELDNCSRRMNDYLQGNKDSNKDVPQQSA